MKKLEKREWIAVAIAVVIVGYLFIYSQSDLGISAMFGGSRVVQTSSPQVTSQDEVVGTGDVAEAGNKIVINYTVNLLDGTSIDSTVTRGEPIQFVIGTGQVIKGLDQGIVGMRTGGKRLLTIPPELAYGSKDYGPIPGNSTILFDVELLKVEKQ